MTFSRKRSRSPRFSSSSAGDALVGLRLEDAERQVLHLPLELPHAEPVRERRVDVVRQPRGLPARRRVVQAHRVAQRLQVIGELDQDDAHVLHHGEQHLAQRLELGGLLFRPQPLLRQAGERPDCPHARHAVHEIGDRLAE